MPEQKTRPLRKILYASFQTGESLPGYVKYALESLCSTGYTVAYLTNERDLDPSSHAFLDLHRIELFFTENRGYDFGMWKRYIQYTARFRREEWERLVLVNDSVVYFQNRFLAFFNAAEESPADVVSLTENDEFAPHLQSFFLYFKTAAISPFCQRLLDEPEGENFYDTVKRLEVGTSVFLRGRGFSLASLFHTERPVLFSYAELVRAKCGFVKRKLLECRWTRLEVFFFLDQGARAALLTDYIAEIERFGFPDSDFDMKWLLEFKKSFWKSVFQRLRLACYRLLWRIRRGKFNVSSGFAEKRSKTFGHL